VATCRNVVHAGSVDRSGSYSNSRRSRKKVHSEQVVRLVLAFQYLSQEAQELLQQNQPSEARIEISRLTLASSRCARRGAAVPSV
jgi:hypothetical protein